MTDRWKRLVPPLAGVGFVACVVVAFRLLNSSPDAGASGAKVAAYFASHHGRAVASAALMAYGAALALVYFTGLASYLRRRGSQILSTLTVAGGVLMAVGMAVAAGTLVAITDKTSRLDASALQAVNQIGSDLPWVMVVGGSAIATLAVGIASLRTSAFPKALGIVITVVGVVAISGIVVWFGFLATGPLTLVVAGYLYQRSGKPDTITMPDVPAQRDAAAETQETSPTSAKA